MHGFRFAELLVAAEVVEDLAHDAAGALVWGELGWWGEERAMRRRISPMENWMAARSSGMGRSKWDWLARRWRGSITGRRVVWW